MPPSSEELRAPLLTPKVSVEAGAARGGIAAGSGRRSDWFGEEVQLLAPQLKAYLRRTFPGVRDVEDVLQDAYLWAWRSQFRAPVRSLRALLFRVARHIAIDRVRRDRAAPIRAIAGLAALPAADERRGVAEAVSAEEKVRLVAEAIVALPARCREALVLYRLQGYTRAEVARRMGLAEKTVDEQVMRGTRRITRYLRARGVVEFDER